MDREICQQVKCGIIPQSALTMQELYECSVEYGAGAFYPCHSDCLQYGKCVHPVNLPLPLSGEATQLALARIETPGPPVEPVLIKDVIPPYPDILGYAVPLVSSSPCDGGWLTLNRWIEDNPGCAVALLATSLIALVALKK